MVEIKNFGKSYSNNVVYKNFNLSLDEDKITCILGESGCGKTTLLNAIAKLIDYEGSITDIKCSYVFQTPRLVPNLTVFENLKLVSKDENYIKRILQNVHLEEKANSYPINLSVGQSQRVALARGFLFESKYILLDEPFSSLDLKLKNEMINLLLTLLKLDNRGVLFVTHNVDEVASIAQRIIVINGGNIIFDKNYDDEQPRSNSYNEQIRKELLTVLLK